MAATPAGRYRDRIQVQQRVPGLDAVGRPNGAWETVAEPWATQLSARALERFAAGQHQGIVDLGLSIRYRVGITASMRIVWRGTPYALLGEPTDMDGNRREMVMLCSSGIRDTHESP